MFGGKRMFKRIPARASNLFRARLTGQNSAQFVTAPVSHLGLSRKGTYLWGTQTASGPSVERVRKTRPMI